MKQELTALEADITAWRLILDQEGVWLFLATLGCWGVPAVWPRFAAFVITGALFGWRAFSQQKDLRPFSPRCDVLEKRIVVEISEENERKALLYDLMMLRQHHLGLRSVRRSVVYFITSGFYVFSFFYSL